MTSPPENDSVPPEASAEAIRANGWHQGAILPHALLIEAAATWGTTIDESNVGIVVSQDCDLIHSSFRLEPYAELLVAVTTSKIDGNRMWAKNPRAIQLTAGDVHLDASIHDRHRLQRELLCEHHPLEQPKLDAESVRQLRSWLARRYKRAAFPDQFNNRVKTVEGKLSKKLKSAVDFTGIYMLVSDDELAAGVDYKIDIRATMLPNDYSDWNKLDKCQSILDDVANLLNSVEGIQVVDHVSLPEDDVSLNDLRYLKRWDWDSLSLRKGTVDPAEEE